MDGDDFRDWAKEMNCIAADRHERPENVVCTRATRAVRVPKTILVYPNFCQCTQLSFSLDTTQLILDRENNAEMTRYVCEALLMKWEKQHRQVRFSLAVLVREGDSPPFISKTAVQSCD